MSMPKDLQELLGDTQAERVSQATLQVGASAQGYLQAERFDLRDFPALYDAGVDPIVCEIGGGCFEAWEPQGVPGVVVVDSTQPMVVLRGDYVELRDGGVAVSLEHPATLRSGTEVLSLRAREVVLWRFAEPEELRSTPVPVPSPVVWPGVEAVMSGLQCASWLAQRAERQAKVASPLGSLVAVGDLLRLWAPVSAVDRERAFSFALKGESPRVEASRGWAQGLEVEPLLFLAQARASSFSEELLEGLESWDAELLEYLPAAFEERDALASLHAVFCLLEQGQILGQQLSCLDAKVSTHNSRLGQVLADQPASPWSQAVRAWGPYAWWVA